MSRGQRMVELAKNVRRAEEVDGNVENITNNVILNEALQHVLIFMDREVLDCSSINQLSDRDIFQEEGDSCVESTKSESKITSEMVIMDNITTKENSSAKQQAVNRTRIVDYTDSEEDTNNIEYKPTEYASYFVQNENNSYHFAENGSTFDTFSSEFTKDVSDGTISSSSSETNVCLKGKKSKLKQNRLEKNRKRRHSGRTYLNYKQQRKEAKSVLPNPCLNKNCINGCNTFSEEERSQIFSLFWNMKNNLEKKGFINGCVNIIPVKRKRTLVEESRRNLTYQYFFMKGDIQIRVCLQFFLSTLNITQKLVRSSVLGKIRENKDNRGKHEPKHKATDKQVNEFKRFIESLPSVPSHYCRSSSAKLYLPSEVKSITNLYRMYTKEMTENGNSPLKISTFKKFFKRDYNIGIHVPKKDKCVRCERFKNIPEEEQTEKDKNDYLNHQKEKDDAKQVFLKEQTRSSQDGFIVVSFDLQKVLSTPHGPSMMFGFTRKYAVYNFTVYESKSQNGYCYIWEEKAGKRGVNEICTNLFKYLVKLDQEGQYHSLSLFCDNCPGQNKNRFVLSMLLYFLRNSNSVVDISITYLVAGHTYMPVDSVHAVIEKYTSKMNIQAPSEWHTLIRNARKRPKPYEVIPVYYNEFLDWKSLSVPKKLKTAEGQEIAIQNVRRAKLSKNSLNCIDMSTSYAPDATIYKIDWLIRKNQYPPQLYSSELPISKEKMKNLRDMCQNLTIKKQYHAEYFNLSSNASVRDELPETDVEDNAE